VLTLQSHGGDTSTTVAVAQWEGLPAEATTQMRWRERRGMQGGGWRGWGVVAVGGGWVTGEGKGEE
jgi:hypothetical protein